MNFGASNKVWQGNFNFGGFILLIYSDSERTPISIARYKPRIKRQICLSEVGNAYTIVSLHRSSCQKYWKQNRFYIFDSATGYFIEVIHQYDAGLGSHTSATVILWEIKLIQF